MVNCFNCVNRLVATTKFSKKVKDRDEERKYFKLMQKSDEQVAKKQKLMKKRMNQTINARLDSSLKSRKLE